MNIDNIYKDSELARPPKSGPATIGPNKVIPSHILEATAPVITEEPTIEENQKSVTKSTKDEDTCCPMDEETKWILCNIFEIVACLLCCPLMCLACVAGVVGRPSKRR